MSSSAAAQLGLFFSEHLGVVCSRVSHESVGLPFLSSVLCFEVLWGGVYVSHSEAQAGNEPPMKVASVLALYIGSVQLSTFAWQTCRNPRHTQVVCHAGSTG